MGTTDWLTITPYRIRSRNVSDVLKCVLETVDVAVHGGVVGILQSGEVNPLLNPHAIAYFLNTSPI